MTKDEVFAKVKDIIVEQLGADESDIVMGASSATTSKPIPSTWSS